MELNDYCVTEALKPITIKIIFRKDNSLSDTVKIDSEEIENCAKYMFDILSLMSEYTDLEERYDFIYRFLNELQNIWYVENYKIDYKDVAQRYFIQEVQNKLEYIIDKLEKYLVFEIVEED